MRHTVNYDLKEMCTEPLEGWKEILMETCTTALASGCTAVTCNEGKLNNDNNPANGCESKKTITAPSPAKETHTDAELSNSNTIHNNMAMINLMGAFVAVIIFNAN